MGSLCTEAIKASEELLNRGVYANVIVVTSSDLLAGNQAYENDYAHLRHGLQVNSNLYIHAANLSESPADLTTVAGRRVPIVSVHDGEPGLLDNIGSIIGVRHESLAVRKHSKCGRPTDVYKYHHIDSDSIFDACGKVLAETALEEVRVSAQVLNALQSGSAAHQQTHQTTNWRDLWEKKS